MRVKTKKKIIERFRRIVRYVKVIKFKMERLCRKLLKNIKLCCSWLHEVRTNFES